MTKNSISVWFCIFRDLSIDVRSIVSYLVWVLAAYVPADIFASVCDQHGFQK
jgi:hypothetical protein